MTSARPATSRWAWASRLALAALALTLTAALSSTAERTPKPSLERARGERCVEPVEAMRRNHMEYLRHQRDETVREGVRGAKHSLVECIDCHASRKTGSVAAARSDFCVSCHAYTGVKIDCFECHSAKPKGGVALRP